MSGPTRAVSRPVSVLPPWRDDFREAFGCYEWFWALSHRKSFMIMAFGCGAGAVEVSGGNEVGCRTGPGTLAFADSRRLGDERAGGCRGAGDPRDEAVHLGGALGDLVAHGVQAD